MDIRQIRCFVALYEEGSITRAARRMHVVQPAISQQIKRLEAYHDVQLFARDAHGVRPNALAHEFYRHCIRVLTELERASAVLSRGSDRFSGKICVGAQASFHQYVMPRALERFRDLYPEVEVLSRDGYRSDLISWLIAGDLDCALLSTTQDLLNMQTRDVSTEALVVVGHRDTLAGREAIGGRELAEWQLVLPSRYKSMRNLIDAHFGLQGITLRPELEVDSLQSLLHITLRPGWLSIIPPMALSSELFGGILRSVALVDPIIRRKVVVAWPRHKSLPTPVDRFVCTLSEILADIPGVEIHEPGPASGVES
ncbi:MAG: LysR family transcriptional regulator [Pigmentiphaga sp.]|uniref:LysR family transcriptional regulator n=1 Tax=Pigmentiphaga sp. TaxID=1977564 RepID=UPI0029BD5AC0|nr:LysR family transcriptional regulator [Pigmentiphaga sp.]MDX3907796.1 LysR family transcriptional regulator [Pigmentiphaga sp.]